MFVFFSPPPALQVWTNSECATRFCRPALENLLLEYQIPKWIEAICNMELLFQDRGMNQFGSSPSGAFQVSKCALSSWFVVPLP